jgi:glycosyltransferase involved in cell wall biosynthesis
MGGAEINTRILREELISNDFDIRVFSRKSKKHTIYTKLIDYIPKRFFLIGSLFSDFLLSLEINKIIDNFKPDIIHVHDFYSISSVFISNRNRDIPIVLTVHDKFPKKIYSHNNILVKILGGIVIKNRNKIWLKYTKMSNKVLAVSKFIKKNLISFGVSRKKIEVLPNIFRLDHIDNLDEKDIRINDRIDILYVGSLFKEKGVNVLIKAYKELTQKTNKIVNLTIVGKGPEKNNLLRLSSNLGIKNIIFIDFTQNEKLNRLYKKSDIIILPTLYEESFGRTVIEAMSFGKVVIGSNIGAIPELIDNGKNGFLFNPGNYIELSNCILEIIKNRKKSKIIKKNSLKTAKKYGNSISKKLIKIYKGIAK